MRRLSAPLLRGEADASRRARHLGEGGSVLLLVPVGALVVALLGSIAIDSAAAFGAQREAAAVAETLANDLATLAVDESAMRRRGAYRIDPARLRRLSNWAQQSAERLTSSVFEPGSVKVITRVTGAASVRVSVTGSAKRIIGLLGGTAGAPSRTVTAQAEGRVVISG